MLARPVDSLLDFAVVPGFSSAGYRLRERSFAPTPDLTGNTYLVTGAGSGLGAAACELLAAAGAGVHMLVRDEEKGARVRAEIAGGLPGATCGSGVATSPGRIPSASSPPPSPRRSASWTPWSTTRG